MSSIGLWLALLLTPASPPPLIHAVYVSGWSFGSPQLDRLIELADTTELNAFVVDLKDDTGLLSWRSDSPLAQAIGANEQLRAPDACRRLRTLKAHGIYSIARIVVAKDPVLSAARPDWAIQRPDGSAWRDSGGAVWLDAFNDSVWVYAGDLAAEAARMGFQEIQFDYVRFPDDVEPGIAEAKFPSRRGDESKRDGLMRHLRYLRGRVNALGIPFTIDVFGFTASAEVPMGVGQVWEDLVNTADVVLPMVYPSHYREAFHEIPYPNAEPYRVVRLALTDALNRKTRVGGTAAIRPYLQAFTQGEPPYTPAMIREEIRAAEELGYTSWVLWNAESVYPAEIFRPEAPTP